MKTDSEPSEYGNHMVMLSIKKDKHGHKKKKHRDDDESSVKRVMQ